MSQARLVTGWVRPEMSKPLMAAVAVLQGADCGLAHLDLVDPALHERLGGPFGEEVLATLATVNEHCHAFRQRQLPVSVRDTVLEGADIIDWRATRFRERLPADEIPRAFHSLRQVLCTTCHPLFDNVGLISVVFGLVVRR